MKTDSLYSLYYHPNMQNEDPMCFVFCSKAEALSKAKELFDPIRGNELDFKKLEEQGFSEFGSNGFVFIKPYTIGERIS